MDEQVEENIVARSIISANTCDCPIEILLAKNISPKTKEEIVKRGKPTPALNLECKKDNYTRHFNTKFYNDVYWLCGCKYFQSFFCWPCTLFSKDKNVWNKHGYRNLNCIHNAIKKHECSQHHISCVVKLKQFSKENKIELPMSEQYKSIIERHNKMVTANRYILRKLIDVVCFLSRQELLFQNQSDNLNLDNRGNYVELLELFSTSDNILKMHLEQSIVFTQLSNEIQSDLIKSISNIILEEIKNEIRTSKFVSIIVDESTKSHVPIIIRYVREKCNIVERFIGFTDVKGDKSAYALFDLILNNLINFECKDKLVAQTYDGAIYEEHNEVQEKLRKICKNTIFVHCYAHNLSLVFSQSLYFIKECEIFFQSLNAFVFFFSKSTKRSLALDQEIKKRFPCHTPVIWNYSNTVLNILIENKTELKSLFLEMIENPQNWDTDTATNAQGLSIYLHDFDFNFLLIVFSEIFSTSDILFDTLQENCFDISFCLLKIQEFLNFLEVKKNIFETIWDNFETEDPISIETYSRKRIKFYDNEERKETYKCLYFKIINCLIRHTTDRFADITKLEFMTLLNVTKFKEYSKQFPECILLTLKLSYESHFDFIKLKSELIYIYSSVSTMKNFNNLIDYILDNDLQDVFVETYKLIYLILTIPVISATADHPFSTMKRIKSYSKNSEYDNFSSLAIISIEERLVSSLKNCNNFYERVIDDFSKNNCRIELQFKK